MTETAGLRRYHLHFDEIGGNSAQGIGQPDLTSAIGEGGIDDLFVFAHGWNAGAASAQATETAIFRLLADQLGDRRQRCATVAVRWPSLLFPEDDPQTAAPTPSSGAMLANALAPSFPRSSFQLDELGTMLDEQPPSMAELERFHTLACSLVSSPSLALEDSGGAVALSADTASLFGMAAAISGRAASRRADRQDSYQALWAGAREVLRILCYYEMKNRAGLIGRDGLGPLLAGLRAPAGPVRIHLIGHSFGARLVAYALAGLAEAIPIEQRSPVKSLYLIQGALSHFAFASSRPSGNGVHAGALAAFARHLDGPLLATFSEHDRLLGWWYPMTSLLDPPPGRSADQAVHQWGAMGHDGPQGDRVIRLPLAAAQAGYQFATGCQYSLDASAVIATNQSSFSGAHSDIAHPEVIAPIVSAAGFGQAWSADLPVTEHDPFRRGELGKSHRPAGV